MVSDKVVRILMSKTDMVRDDILKLTEAEAWRLVYSTRTKKKKDNRLQICFSGFGASKKQELINIAECNMIHVVTSITKKLDFLCIGEHPGPVKLEKAESQGVQLITESQFIELIETGEIPKLP